MWAKQLAIYIHESQIIWESLPFLVKKVLLLPHPVFKHIFPKLAKLYLLTT